MERRILRALAPGIAAGLIMIVIGGVVGTKTALADGVAYHNPGGGTINAPCAGCHRVHTAPGGYLLKTVGGVSALCASCHQGAATGSDLNVDTGNSNSTGGCLRGGGFVSTDYNTADPSDTGGSTSTVACDPGSNHPTTSMHNLGVANGPMWGNGTTPGNPAPTLLASFSCANCHDPHGGANAGGPTFRILRPIPTGSGAGAGVVVTDETAGAARHYTLDNWYLPRKDLVPNDTTGKASAADVYTANAGLPITLWCGQCHTAYPQVNFPADEFTPNGLAGTWYEDKFQHNTIDYRENPPGTFAWSASRRSCNKCHAAHGTSAAMHDALNTTTDIKYPDGSSVAGNAASRLLKTDDRALCRKCHTQ